MAKAVAICVCGTCGGKFEKVKRNCYNRREANSWEEWAVGTYTECDDCAEARAKATAERDNLPELKGSQKQVAWASELRENVTKYLLKAKTIKFVSESRPLIIKKIDDAVAASDKKLNNFREALEYINENGLFPEMTEAYNSLGHNLFVESYSTKKTDAVKFIVELDDDEIESYMRFVKEQDSAKFWIDKRDYCDVKSFYDRFFDEIFDEEDEEEEETLPAEKPAAVEEKPAEKKNDKIISIRNGGRYDDWFFIKWDGYNDELYNEAREIDASYYDKPGVAVARKSVRALVDYAERYGFDFTDKAKKEVEKELAEADEREKREAEAKKTEPERTVCIRYKDYKNGVFAGRIQKTGEYYKRDRTIEAIMLTLEDAEFARDYYDKNKKKVSDELKKSQFKSGEIDEYEITPAKIDADSLVVEVPEELKNVNTAAG